MAEQTTPNDRDDELSYDELQSKLDKERRLRREAEEERDEAVADAENTRQRLADLESGIRAYREVVEAAAEGDLTRRMETGHDLDTMERLAGSYNQMVTAWEETLEEVAKFGDDVTAATEHVHNHVETVKKASKRVSEALEEISEDTSEQDSVIQEIAEEMSRLSATIEEIAASADEVANQVNDVVDRGELGRESAQVVVENLNELEDQTIQTVEKVEQLNGQMEEIEQIIEFINDIAEQTNILALNANIEAARAGESGAGFEVVASEVKELANETQGATEEIRASIRSVRKQADETVTEIHGTQETVETSADSVEDALSAFENIVDDIEDVNSSVREISDATDTQADSTQEVVGMVDEVETLSEETAIEADRASAAAQDQSVALSEMGTSVNTLSDRASALESQLEAFNTDKDRAGSVGPGAATTTTIRFWHAMSGEKAVLLEEMASDFEEQAEDVRLELESRGSYRGTLNDTLAAIESGDPPAIAQIFEIGTKQAIDSGGFVPVEQVIPSETSLDDLLDPVLNYYRTDGTLYSMPFNSSNPVLCYNKNAFRAAGLDPDDPPETFEAIADAAEKLVDSSVVEYGITFANYSWFVEQWFAEAGQELVDQRNGRGGIATTASFDSDASRDIFEWWTSLDANGLYYNPGIEARGKAKSTFHDERSAMLIGSTSSLAGIESGATEAGFEMGTGYLPVANDRNGVVVGGASLWVADGVSSEAQSVAGEFLAWLTQPDQQVRWHRNTGYFPIHLDAIRELQMSGWFDQNPHYITAFDQLRDQQDMPATNGARIGPFDKVRTIIEEGYEEMTVETVEEQLSKVNEQIERQLERYHERQS